VAEAYRAIVKDMKHPAALVLSRQNCPTLDRAKLGPASDTAKGAYIISEAPSGKPDVILMATGSELPIAMAGQELLTKEGIQARVVSMPCFEWFEEQDQAYRNSVLPPSIKARVAVEAGLRQCWEKYLGPDGRFVGMSSYGASGPFAALYKHFGITAENVAAEAKKALGK